MQQILTYIFLIIYSVTILGIILVVMMFYILIEAVIRSAATLL